MKSEILPLYPEAKLYLPGGELLCEERLEHSISWVCGVTCVHFFRLPKTDLFFQNYDFVHVCVWLLWLSNQFVATPPRPFRHLLTRDQLAWPPSLSHPRHDLVPIWPRCTMIVIRCSLLRHFGGPGESRIDRLSIWDGLFCSQLHDFHSRFKLSTTDRQDVLVECRHWRCQYWSGSWLWR